MNTPAAAFPKTRSEVEKWCADREIELSVEKWSGAVNHVHANIDAERKVFRAHGLHNVALWDDVNPPDWSRIGRELVAADFGECTDPDCEYCASAA